jgi:hypothetical protein
MTAQSAFEWLCREIERSTGLDAPVARGTARLAVKEAGLDPEGVSREQLEVVVRELLPTELEALRIAGVERLCERLLEGLGRQTFDAGADRAGSAADVLERLGR